MKINIDPDCIETDDNNCTQATAFRFMPFKGSEGLTGRRGVVQPGSLIENTFDSTNTDAIKAELKKIFEPLARGSPDAPPSACTGKTRAAGASLA